MNKTSSSGRADVLQDRYGLKTASYLADAASALPYDISERLRAARVQAVARRKVEAPQLAPAVFGHNGSATLAGGPDHRSPAWWTRLAAALPLIALVVGLLAISSIQNDRRAEEVAEVDAALLTDELPPAAFSDPGFVQFLKSTR